MIYIYIYYAEILFCRPASAQPPAKPLAQPPLAAAKCGSLPQLTQHFHKPLGFQYKFCSFARQSFQAGLRSRSLRNGIIRCASGRAASSFFTEACTYSLEATRKKKDSSKCFKSRSVPRRLSELARSFSEVAVANGFSAIEVRLGSSQLKLELCRGRRR